jgi:fibronectin-binding autotransporter adhesin
VIEIGATLDVTTANLPTGGPITNAGGILVFDQSTTGTFSGVMSDGAEAGGPNDGNELASLASGPVLSGTLIKDDSSGSNGGNIAISAVQAYSGFTYIEAGTLTLGVANAIADSAGVVLGRVGGAGGTPPTMNGGATAILALNANEQLTSLSDDPSNNTLIQLNGHTLTLAPTATSGSSYGGIISDGSAAGSLVIDGTGTVTLHGINTFSGGVTIDSGTLELGNASAAGTSAIEFGSANATLKIDLGDAPTGSGNVIENFAIGDSIDLAGVGTETSFSYNAGVLTLSGGSQSVTLNIAAPPAHDDFSLASDNSRGTLLTLAVVAAPAITTLVGQPVNGSTIQVQGTGQSGDTVTLYADGGNTPVGTGAVVGGTFNITTTATFVDGNHTLMATETDGGGVTSVASASFPVAVDPNAPVITTLVGQPANGSKIEVQGTGEVGDTVTLYAGGGTTAVGSGLVLGNGTFDITTTATFAAGPHVFTAIEKDSAGLTSTASQPFDVTVGNVWIGPSSKTPIHGGPWNTAADWNGGVPGLGDDAILDPSVTAYTVTSSQSTEIGAVTIDAATMAASITAVLDITGGAFTVDGPSSNAGTIKVEAGALLELKSALTNTGALSVTGSGVVDLVGGSISGGTVSIAAGATLEATGGSSEPSTIGGGAAVTGNGALLATNNTSVTLDNVTITNATLETSGGGAIGTQVGSDITFIGIAIGTAAFPTTVTVVDGSTLTLQGTIDIATGSGIQLGVPAGAGATIDVATAGAKLSDGGTLALSSSGNDTITGVAGGGTLTNDGDTISGAGYIGDTSAPADGELTLTNKGTIVANVADGVLTIDTANPVANSGTLEATGGGELIIHNTTINSTASGTVEASDTAPPSNPSIVLLNDATIKGGTLSATSGDIIETAAGSSSNTLDGVTLQGTVTVVDGTALTLAGTITDDGTIALNSTVDATDLVIQGSVSLKGSGYITLSTHSSIVSNGAAATLDNFDNISGTGQIGDANLNLINEKTGIIDATGPLTISGGVANSGTIEANGGNITIGGALTGAGQVDISGGHTVTVGGALNNSVSFAGTNASLISQADQNQSFTVDGFALSDSIDFTKLAQVTGIKITSNAAQNTTNITLTGTDASNNPLVETLHLFNATPGQYGTSVNDYSVTPDHNTPIVGTLFELAGGGVVG